VGVDRILAEANVTRATMDRHFKGKDDLIEAYLALEDAVIRGYFEDAAAHAGPDTDMLELVIDGIAGDIERYHTRGCSFINAAAEYPDPVAESGNSSRRIAAGFAVPSNRPRPGARIPPRSPHRWSCCGMPRWSAATSTVSTPSNQRSSAPPVRRPASRTDRRRTLGQEL